MRKSWRGNWDYEKETNASYGAVFEKKARDHEARQGGAKEEVKDNLNRNGKRSYASLEKAINQLKEYNSSTVVSCITGICLLHCYFNSQ